MNITITPEQAERLRTIAASLEYLAAEIAEQRTPMIALDLFAGTGWGVACQRLGIDEYGVELMPEARATREAAGMRRAQWDDVWELLAAGDVDSPEFKAALLIASPPCQTFSVAGNGAGRRALDDVLSMINSGAHTLPTDGMRHEAESLGLDDRTALVLTPLAYAYRHRPRLIALEQVPTVLPVWEAIATELRALGYSVAVGNLQAEQYGVPQTRKRAILVARNDGAEARLPEPTHSRYHTRNPERLDPGMLPWVSMAEALGMSAEPGDVTVRTSMGTPKVDGRNGTHELDPAVRPSHTITTKSDSFTLRSNYGTGGDSEKRGERAGEQPAATITSKADRMKWQRPAPSPSGDRLTVEEAAILQSFPPGFTFAGKQGKQFLQVGNAVPPLLAEAILATFLEEQHSGTFENGDRECANCGENVAVLGSRDECAGCEALPHCSQCGETFNPDGMFAGHGLCESCRHNAIRSGWEPSAE